MTSRSSCLGGPLMALITLVIISTGRAEENLRQKSILESMLSGYEVNEWPTSNMNKPTTISVQMFVNSFGSLNAANMDYTIDVFLRQTWTDHRLSFGNLSNKDTMVITAPAFQQRLWKPDTYFDNVKEASFHTVTMPNILLRINSTGYVLYSIRASLRLTCNMEFVLYPFDVQHCGIHLSSYANTDDIIKYHWKTDVPIALPEHLEIAQFDLIGQESSELTNAYSTGNFSGLRVDFYLRRQNGYHVLQTYIPTILIVTISWVSFWLDPNAVPGRVSLGVTTLLTLTTLASGVRQQLPPVSYVKAIDVWVGMCMIMVFGALLEFTLVNWMANKKILVDHRQTLFKLPTMLTKCSSVTSFDQDPDASVQQRHQDQESRHAEEASPGQAKKQNQDEPPAKDNAEAKPTTYISFARALDRICRAVFPATFLLFNLAYWPYYLLQQQHAIPVNLQI
ncbi:glycine receptor subunit alpha-2-like [Oratosquilla oratoria]|uniref:glycine receptor subunit alpha-2-like n=1 Tax=Oratosquilla oratoria TaxID=337810 RepID=UPI003F75B880